MKRETITEDERWNDFLHLLLPKLINGAQMSTFNSIWASINTLFDNDVRYPISCWGEDASYDFTWHYTDRKSYVSLNIDREGRADWHASKNGKDFYSFEQDEKIIPKFAIEILKEMKK